MNTDKIEALIRKMKEHNVIYAMDAKSIEDRLVADLLDKRRKVSDIIYERNGEVSGIRLLMLSYYGARLTNEQKDELLICSRIAQRG